MKKRIISILMAVLMLSALFVTGAYAGEGEPQPTEGDFGTNLHWAYVSGTEGGTLTITIKDTQNIVNAMGAYNSAEETPWAYYNASIRAVSLPDGLLDIASNAFAGTVITEIKVPSSVATIGGNAFPASLTTITAPCDLEDSLPEVQTLKITHDVEEVAEVPATATTTGKRQHWKCKDCGKLFTDANYTTETTDDALVIAKLDTEAPKHTQIVFGASSVAQPADASAAQTSVSVTVYATDLPSTAGYASGIAQGKITLKHSTNTLAPDISCTLTNQNSGTLTGTLPISFTTPSGSYYVSELFLADNVGLTSTAKDESTKLTVTRATKVNSVATLTFNTTSVGYGGTVKGTIILKDSAGNVLPNKTFEVYVGTTKTSTTATTDSEGKATFNYTNSISGTYSIKATFAGDTDYNACETSAVSVTFTTVPATGDSYDLGLWICVAAMAIGVNAWFIIRKRRA